MLEVSKAAFQDALRKLHNLDYWDLPFLCVQRFTTFRRDPCKFFTRADNETADKIWDAMEAFRPDGSPPLLENAPPYRNPRSHNRKHTAETKAKISAAVQARNSRRRNERLAETPNPAPRTDS